MGDKKTDVKSRIIRYLTKADITLTSDEEEYLLRVEFVDHLMRAGLTHDDIVLKHTGKFKKSKSTADNDISAAQEIYGKSRKINRAYLAHWHLEEIAQDLKKIRQGLFFIKDEKGVTIECQPDAKEIAALAKMHDSYTKQLHEIPQEIDVDDAGRPIQIFQLVAREGQQLPSPISIIQAMKEFHQLKNTNTIEEAEMISDDPE